MHIIQNIQFKTIKKDPFVTQINRKSKVAFFTYSRSLSLFEVYAEVEVWKQLQIVFLLSSV